MLIFRQCLLLIFSDEMTENLSDSSEFEDEELVPEKSKFKYQKTYEAFKKWCLEKNCTVVNERVLLAYFSKEQSKYSTAWSIYSMLRLTLKVNDNVNIANYTKLKDYLKSKSDGYHAKSSRSFTKDEIYRFIKDAPNVDFLAAKVHFLN